MRAKLLNRDTMFRDRNNNMLSNDEFLKTLKILNDIILSAQPCMQVEFHDAGSLT